MFYKRASLEERFFSKVKKTENCWIWIASTQAGYGQLWCLKRKRAVTAHLLSYEIHKGEVPKGMCVCHKCDNPICVNPDHLWLGTHAENMRDMYKKGRNTGPKNRARGERHGMAKLKLSQVVEIRKTKLPEYGRNTILSKEYGVNVQIIKRILRGETWVQK